MANFYNETFINYTGKKYEFILNRGVHIFHLWGASGSGAVSSAYGVAGIPGKGGYIQGTIFLRKKTKVFAYVGSKGVETQNKCTPDSYQEFQGAFNGGGGIYTSGIGGAGGGSTDIRFNRDEIESRVLVAGGGGGAGFGSIGGDGGYPNGTDGFSVADKVHQKCLGIGGSQTSGGLQKECSTGNCIEKSTVNQSITNTIGGKALGGYGIGKSCGGSSGGGGYYGGGGTYNAGGAGGGSSYVNPIFSYFKYENGVNEGNGMIFIQSIYNNLVFICYNNFNFMTSIFLFICNK